MREAFMRNRHANLTELPRLNEYVLFSNNLDRPCLNAKAMQSRYIFFFLQDLLSKHIVALREKCETANALHASAVSLRRLYSAVLAAGPQVDRPRYCIDQMLGHLLQYQKAGCICAPKHHVALEMVRRQAQTGNIRFISEYPDEGGGKCTHRRNLSRNFGETTKVTTRTVWHLLVDSPTNAQPLGVSWPPALRFILVQACAFKAAGRDL